MDWQMRRWGVGWQEERVDVSSPLIGLTVPVERERERAGLFYFWVRFWGTPGEMHDCLEITLIKCDFLTFSFPGLLQIKTTNHTNTILTSYKTNLRHKIKSVCVVLLQ